MSWAPKINLHRNGSAERFDDGTQVKVRPMHQMQSLSNAYHTQDGEKKNFLPQISSTISGNTGENFTSTAATYYNKKDFFKLGPLHDNVQREQNEIMIKKIYAKQINKKYNKRFKSTGRYMGKGRPLSPLYNEKDFGNFETPHEAAVANQRLNKDHLIRERFKQVKNLQLSTFDEFDKATAIEQNEDHVETYTDRSKPLFKHVLEAEEARVHVHTRKAVQAQKKSSIKTVDKASFKAPRRQSVFVKSGRVTSSQHLLAIVADATKNQVELAKQNISELYLPEEARKFKKKDKKKKQPVAEEQPTATLPGNIKKTVTFELDFQLHAVRDYAEAMKQEQEPIIVKKRKRREQNVILKTERRRASFSDKLMKYDDWMDSANPLRDRQGHSDKELAVIERIKRCRRYPIPERLLHAPRHYDIFIDSILTAGYQSDEICAGADNDVDIEVPYQSAESEEEIDFKSDSSGSEEIVARPESPEKKPKSPKKPGSPDKKGPDDELVMKRKKKKGGVGLKIPDKDVWGSKFHAFDLESLMAYPHQYTEGMVPIAVFRDEYQEELKRLEANIWPRLLKEFEKQKENSPENPAVFPTIDHIQAAYEQLCEMFVCTPIKLSKFVRRDVFSFRNQTLPMNQIKIICCVLPLIAQIRHLKFENNQLQDEFGPLVLMAAFTHPKINEITIVKNFMRGSFGYTLYELMTRFPKRIKSLNFSNSIVIPEHLEPLCYIDIKSNPMRGLPQYKFLRELNFSGCPLSAPTCKNLGSFLIYSTNLRNLNISNCKLQNQATRSIVDGLNRNNTLQYFDFSSNFMQSKIYEFSIKFAMVLKRHRSLMHVDISQTGLQRQEVLFIGMAVSASSSCLSIHMSANGLDYYERIFLRTLANASVASHFRNLAQQKGSLRSQKERNQVLELKNHDFSSAALQDFVKRWNYIDEQRLGVDEEINMILKELDVTEIFRQLRLGDKTGAESSEMLQDLIVKIEQRKEEIANQKLEMEMEQDEESQRGGLVDFDDAKTVNNFKEIYELEDHRDSPVKKARNLREADDQDPKNEFYNMQQVLKVERINQKLRADKDKQKRAKSAGEMALMFMGINKIAYDLLLENPMTGYMNEVIFTRILGNDDIYRGHLWKDCSQCYVCEKWDKVNIQHDTKDEKKLRKYTMKLEELHDVLQQTVKISRKRQEKLLDVAVKPMYDESTPDPDSPERQVQQEEEESYHSIETASEDKILTESMPSMGAVDPNEDVAGQGQQALDKGNIISTVKLDAFKIKSQLPGGFQAIRNVTIDQAELPMSEYSDLDEYRAQIKTPEDFCKSISSENDKTTQKPDNDQIIPSSQIEWGTQPQIVEAYSDQEETEKDESMQATQEAVSAQIEALEMESKEEAKKVEDVTKTAEGSIETNKEKKYRTVRKTVFFQGAAFIIEEEESIASDEEVSVKTSEDEFDVQEEVKTQLFDKQLEKRRINEEEPTKEIARLVKELGKNRVLELKNIFSRDNVYLVASFNDWVPIVMQTTYEIKQMRKQEDLEKFLKDPSKRISKKAAENIISYCNYVPPGKHFFYYIYKNDYIFLSPKYDIVRFKGSNVFLNTIKVSERQKELQQVTLGRNIYTTEMAKFNKDKSVWKDFQEDTEEFLHKMLMQDIEYGKLLKIKEIRENKERVIPKIFSMYLEMKNIFMFLAANSSYPTLSFNDTTEFVRRSQLFGKYLSLARMDQLMIATNQSNNKYKANAERELHRYEFVEFIVRLSQTVYRDSKREDNIMAAIDAIFNQDVKPNNPSVNGQPWREEFMYNLKVDEILRKNLGVIQKLFDTFLTPNKKFVTLEECTKLMKNSNMQISDLRMNPCYAESMMSRIDTLSDTTSLLQMKFVEFLVFLCRAAHEVYIGKDGENQPLAMKVDAVLKKVLLANGLQPTFTFKDMGASDSDDIDDEEMEGSQKLSVGVPSDSG